MLRVSVDKSLEIPLKSNDISMFFLIFSKFLVNLSVTKKPEIPI